MWLSNQSSTCIAQRVAQKVPIAAPQGPPSSKSGTLPTYLAFRSAPFRYVDRFDEHFCLTGLPSLSKTIQTKLFDPSAASAAPNSRDSAAASGSKTAGNAIFALFTVVWRAAAALTEEWKSWKLKEWKAVVGSAG